jgi:hypothetical protein
MAKVSPDEASAEIRDTVTTAFRNSVIPFCYFATAIWNALQHNENSLSPEDAYWLGAVDEVYDSQLPCLREIAESEVEQSNLPLTT